MVLNARAKIIYQIRCYPPLKDLMISPLINPPILFISPQIISIINFLYLLPSFIYKRNYKEKRWILFSWKESIPYHSLMWFSPGYCLDSFIFPLLLHFYPTTFSIIGCDLARDGSITRLLRRSRWTFLKLQNHVQCLLVRLFLLSNLYLILFIFGLLFPPYFFAIFSP